MRTYTFFLILFLSINYINAQLDFYVQLAGDNQIEHLPTNYDELQSKTIEYYIKDIETLMEKAKKKGKTVYYNNSVLNKYFSEVITNYASNTGDLSFNNYFINTSSTEKTLTIGKSFRLDNFFLWSKEKRKAVKQIRPIQKVGNLLLLYFKSDLSKGFSTIYSKDSETEEYNFNSNIGLGLKFTHVFNGNINAQKQKDKIDFIRESIVKEDIQKTINKYDKNSFNKELQLQNFGVSEEDKNNRAENEKKLIRKKHLEFYEAIADKELSYAKSKKLIESSNQCWYSLEFFIPLTRKKVSYSLDNSTIQEVKFGNWQSKINLNYLRNNNLFLDGSSLKLTGEASVFNTNSFIANNSEAVSFQNIIQVNETNQVEGSSSSVFLGDYEDFIATSLKIEAVSLIFGNTVGFSGAIEKRMGEVENTNWKLGIPFSLKDKEGKPSVNFELQWREINSSHTVGISVGYNFGKFIR